jgi:hypothetical protein
VQYPLNENGEVTLDSGGNGTLRMRPAGGSETWQPAVVSVSTGQAQPASEAQCKIYIGPAAAAQYFVDGTLSGSTGDSTDRVSGYQVDTHGSYLWAVWSGGDPGATGILQVNGTRQVP